MADKRSSSVKPAVRSTPAEDLTNVEFLDSALDNPLNVLRAKLKDLSELPDDVLVRRVLVITDLWGADGRELDVVWSSSPNEPPFMIQDSIVSLLTRVQFVMTSGDD